MSWSEHAGSVTAETVRTRRPGVILGWAALVVAVLVTGCGRDVELETAYGRRRGRAAASVNGTGILAEMYRAAGGRPASIMRLSSSLDRYDVLVWAADDFELPSDEVREFIENWLQDSPERTFVYIGRDYDAACDYWQTMSSRVTGDQQLEYVRRAARARAAHSRARVGMPAEAICEWMVLRRDYPGRQVVSLGGPWASGVDAADSRIWLQGQIDIPTEEELETVWKATPPNVMDQPRYTPLLVSGDKTLAYEITQESWEGSRIVIVSNGSFLLNLPLVNHEHRRLASRLIESCHPFSRVAFLEVPENGLLTIGDYRSVNEEMKRRRVLLALHWLVLGAIFCFSAFPIFGRPRQGAEESVADFGQHVDALAALLQRTGDACYAREQVDLYRRHRGGEKSSAAPARTGRPQPAPAADARDREQPPE